MSIKMVIELDDKQHIQPILIAIEAYKEKLQASINRTKTRLQHFEQRYDTTTSHFLADMVAEDLAQGDWEYIEWAGEAKLLEGLESELEALENVKYQLP